MQIVFSLYQGVSTQLEFSDKSEVTPDKIKTHLQTQTGSIISTRVATQLAKLARDGFDLGQARVHVDASHTALAALDPTLELTSVRGVRHVPLGDFYTGYRRSVLLPDELLTAIELRIPAPGASFLWRKVGTRQAQAISKVALAAVAERDGGGLARLGLGMASVAPVVSFLPTVRALGLSRPLADLSDEALDAATDADISPIDDVRSTAAYRRHVARVLVRSFFAALR